MRHFLSFVVAAMLCAPSVQSAEIAPSQLLFDSGSVANSLTGQAGDAVAGRKIFANRKMGNCLACHQNSDLEEHSFHGEVGPTLNGVASRWSAAELRGIVANAKMMFEGTIMPGFYVTEGVNRPLKKFEGKTILTAQQVEDVVAYLLTLNEE